MILMRRAYTQGLAYLVIVLFSIIVCSGFLVNFFPVTHEYFSPIVRLVALDEATEDNLLVKWLPSIAGGAGQPIFEFYPPASYYAAELFHLIGFTFIDAIKVTIVSSFFLSGLFMYHLIKRVLGNETAALFAAIAYMAFPYHFVDSNLRGDLAETFAFIFIPLIFYFLYIYTQDNNVDYVILAGVSYAFLILSHILVGYMLGFFVIIYFLMHKNSIRFLAIFGLIALSVSSFYWLPALVQRKYVNFNYLIADGYQLENNFIHIYQLVLPSEWEWGSSGPGIYNTMPLSLGIFTLLIITLYLIFKPKGASFFFLSVILSCLFVTDLGVNIIKFIPLTNNLQFPWRFLIITAFASSALTGFVVSDLMKFRSNKVIVFSLFIILIYSLHPMISIPGGYFTKDYYESYNISSFYLIEYLPRTNLNPPPEQFPDITYNGIYVLNQKRSNSWEILTESNRTSSCEVKILYFPKWKVFVDGAETNTRISNIGTTVFDVPPGKHVIEIKYCDNLITAVSKLISLLATVSIIAFLILRRYSAITGLHPR